VIITDHPMWIAAATGGPAIALPDEPPAAVADLARAYGAEWLLIMDDRGRYPASLLETAPACLAAPPERIGPPDDAAWLFRLDTGCAS
jgi:hypothetical protein